MDNYWRDFRSLSGIGLWLTSPGEGYQLISAIILGWSVSFAWTQLVAFGYGRIGRIAGFSLFAGAAIVYGLIHIGFYSLLQNTIRERSTTACICSHFAPVYLVGRKCCRCMVSS